MEWIWQNSEFGNFNYDKNYLKPLIDKIDNNIDKLKYILNLLSQKEKDNLTIDILTNETFFSSLIEGEVLKRESVRDSLRKRIDTTFNYIDDKSTPYTDVLSEVMIDSFFNHSKLTINRLKNWNRAVIQNKASLFQRVNPGKFRDYDDMIVASGPIGKERVEYLAPPANMIDMHISKLIDYVNNLDENPYIKSAIAHLYFVSIHPFDDGNGRVARLISNYILSKEIGNFSRFFSISHSIENNKKLYYEALSNTTNLLKNSKFDFTNWNFYFLKEIENAINITHKEIKKVAFRVKFWDYAKEYKLNERQKKVLGKMLEFDEFEGGMSASKYKSIAKTSKATATRDLRDLLAKKLLVQVEGTQGKSTKYQINRNIDKSRLTIDKINKIDTNININW